MRIPFKNTLLLLIVLFAGTTIFAQAITQGTGAWLVTSVSPASGGPGTVVTISGGSFTPALNAVYFDGVPAASFAYISSTTITAVVGAGATGDVTINIPGEIPSPFPAPTFTFIGPPSISSFSPASGPVGTSVTITGNNFDATAQNDIVNFGGMQAVVTSASITSLTVTVPSGATYEPVTVTTHKLTATAQAAFDVSFSASDTVLSTTSFAPYIALPDNGQPIGYPDIADYDMDGKNDIMMGGYFASLAFYKNNSGTGGIELAARKDYLAFNQPIEFADMNGDGYRDVISEFAGNSVFIYQNKSTAGTIVLDTTGSSMVPVTGYPSFVAVQCVVDLDGDGKPDIVSSVTTGTLPPSLQSKQINVFRNTSSAGSLSFTAGMQAFSCIGNAKAIVAADMDGDGKPDLVVVSDSCLALLRNTSTVGAISFAAATRLTLTDNPQYPSFVDLDGDGKPELLTADYPYAIISVMKNTSASGSISFGPELTFPTGVGPYSIAIGDIDGDGKPDLAVANHTSANVSVLRNNSTGGVISFQPHVDYPLAGSPTFISIGDLDGDSKPDIVVSSTGTNMVYVLHNLLRTTNDLCLPIGSTVLASSLSGISYQWQADSTGTGNSYVNITDNVNYTGTNTAALQLSNIPSSWTGYQYRCVVDGNNSSAYTLKFLDTWTGATSSAWEDPANWSCGTVPDANTDVIINSGTIILSSNTVVKNLTLAPGVNFTISDSYNLTITH